MRLLIEIGYKKLLLQQSANVAAILAALAEADVVEEKSESYSTPSKYAVTPKESFPAPVFVSESQVIDEDQAAEMDIDALKKSNATLHRERYAAVEELKKLKEKVNGLTTTKD